MPVRGSGAKIYIFSVILYSFKTLSSVLILHKLNSNPLYKPCFKSTVSGQREHSGVFFFCYRPNASSLHVNSDGTSTWDLWGLCWGPWRGGGGGVLMTHVDFEKCQCCKSLSLIISYVSCRIWEMPMSHVTIGSKHTSLSLRVMPPFRI